MIMKIAFVKPRLIGSGASCCGRRTLPSPQELSTAFNARSDTARKRKAKSLELRAIMSLARLFSSQGRRDEARSMLAEIYGWFTEGFDTADVKDAKELLEELSR